MQDAKRRAIIFTVLAVLLAITAGVLFMQQVDAVNAKLGGLTTIYVAKQEIASRQPLKAEHFRAVEVPKQYVQASAVTNLAEIENTVSVVPLSEGSLLTTETLKPITQLTSPKKRMVILARSERTDGTSVSFDGAIEANDRVDIVVSRGDQNSGKTETVVFMKDVPVVTTLDDKSGVKAVGLELSLEKARQLVHENNFAISIRVLKAPQSAETEKEDEDEEEADQTQDGNNQSQTGSTP